MNVRTCQWSRKKVRDGQNWWETVIRSYRRLEAVRGGYRLIEAIIKGQRKLRRPKKVREGKIRS